jgi:ABC-type dipeptide/oligopeptide/nickel transport system permease subunit
LATLAIPPRLTGGAALPSPLVILALATVVTVALVAALAPWLAPFEPLHQSLLARNQGPGPGHLLGTDHLGRDVLSRALYGARMSLLAGIGGLVVALALGGGLGLVAAALGGPVGWAVFGVLDVVRAMPGVLFALLLVVALGAGLGSVVLALGLTFAPIFARVAHATYAREAATGHVEMAEVFGSGRLAVLRRHILPNVAGAFITQGAIILPRCIVTESVMSFLGLGAAPDTPTWGRMIAQASPYVEIAPLPVLVPVLALSLFTLSLALLGNALRRSTDPLRRGAAR